MNSSYLTPTARQAQTPTHNAARKLLANAIAAGALLVQVAALGAGALATNAHAHDAAAQATGAKTAQAKPQSAHYRFSVGDVQVVALSDGSVPQDLHALLKGTSASEIDTILAKSFMANPIEASINAYLIDTGKRIALVDTGAGSLFGPGVGGKLVESLRTAGYRPDQIDDVLLTHVHTDHSGGLVNKKGEVIFRKATIHVGQADLDFFLNPANQRGVNGYDKVYFEQATLSLRPYVKANKVKGFDAEGEIFPGVRAVPTPGHTPGHAFFVLQSKGETVEFIGDVLHAQSVQMPRPDITIVYDVEQPAAKSQREKQFSRLADSRHRVAGAHLPFPGLGYIRKEAAGFTYVPADYKNR